MSLATIRRVITSQPVVSLTFDDGPHPEFTPKALSLMDKYGMKGTWFILGKSALEYPGLLASIGKRGHDIATHSYVHVNLVEIDANSVSEQMRQTKEVITQQAGKFWPMIRPPYGAFNAAVLQAAGDLGYQWNVLWSVDVRDWEASTDQIASGVIAGLAPGAIILLHEITARTTQALPGIFAEMQRRGFLSIPLSQMLKVETAMTPVPFCRELFSTSPYMSGEDVEAVQVQLSHRGYDLGLIDGVYGPATAAAVTRFQASLGLTPTGSVDRSTYKALAIRCLNSPRKGWG